MVVRAEHYSDTPSSKTPFLRFLCAQPLDVFQNLFLLPFVAVIIDTPLALAVNERREGCVLHLAGVGPRYVDAEQFPNFAQFSACAGEKRPTFEIRFESTAVVFQDCGAVPLRVGRYREQQIVLYLLLVECALNPGKMGREEGANIGAGCENKGRQDQLAACVNELKCLTVLVNKFEIRHSDVDGSPADLCGFFGRQRDVRQGASRHQYRAESQDKDQPANLRS